MAGVDKLSIKAPTNKYFFVFIIFFLLLINIYIDFTIKLKNNVTLFFYFNLSNCYFGTIGSKPVRRTIFCPIGSCNKISKCPKVKPDEDRTTIAYIVLTKGYRPSRK